MRELVQRARATAREEGSRAFLLKALRYPFKAFFVPGAVDALQQGRERPGSLDELYDFVNGFNHRGITIASWQKKSEIVGLLRLLERSRPGKIAEIGTANGGTLFMLTHVAAPDATIVSVDLPGGRLGGVPSPMRHSYPQWRARLYRGFGRGNQVVNVIRGDSRALATVEDVRRRLPEGKVDFLFIDGDHSYEGCAETSSSTRRWSRRAGLLRFTTSSRAGRAGLEIPAMCLGSGGRSATSEPSRPSSSKIRSGGPAGSESFVSEAEAVTQAHAKAMFG